MRKEQLNFIFYDDLLKAEEEKKRKQKKVYTFTSQSNGKPSDNQLIIAAQKAYRADKSKLPELYNLIKDTAKRMIISERRKKGFYLDYKDEGEDKALTVADYILCQYMTRPSFELECPSAYIYLRVRAALYRYQEIDKHTIHLDYEL